MASSHTTQRDHGGLMETAESLDSTDAMEVDQEPSPGGAEAGGMSSNQLVPPFGVEGHRSTPPTVADDAGSSLDVSRRAQQGAAAAVQHPSPRGRHTACAVAVQDGSAAPVEWLWPAGEAPGGGGVEAKAFGCPLRGSGSAAAAAALGSAGAGSTDMVSEAAGRGAATSAAAEHLQQTRHLDSDAMEGSEQDEANEAQAAAAAAAPGPSSQPQDHHRSTAHERIDRRDGAGAATAGPQQQQQGGVGGGGGSGRAAAGGPFTDGSGGGGEGGAGGNAGYDSADEDDAGAAWVGAGGLADLNDAGDGGSAFDDDEEEDQEEGGEEEDDDRAHAYYHHQHHPEHHRHRPAGHCHGPQPPAAAAAQRGARAAGPSTGAGGASTSKAGAAGEAGGDRAGAGYWGPMRHPLHTNPHNAYPVRRPQQPASGPDLVAADPWSDDEDEEPDTTAEQFYAAANPKDIQGIPWERLQFNRSTYRETRLRQYRNYTNLLPEDDGGAYHAELAPLCAAPRRCGTAGAPPTAASAGRGSGAGPGSGSGPGSAGGSTTACARGPPFFAFVRNSRAVQSNIVHFQLRNLVWATSPNDVFVVHENCVNHWNPASRTVTEVLNLGGGGGGGGVRGVGSGRVPGLGRMQVSTLCVAGDLVAAGGFMGEVVVKRLRGESAAAAVAAAAAGGASSSGRAPVFPALRRSTQASSAAALAAARRGAAGAGGAAGAAAAGTGAGTGSAAGAAAAAAVRGGAKPGVAGGGGMQGTLLYAGRVTASDNGITNGLEIYADRSAGTVVMAANNDAQLRLFAAAAGEGALRPLARWPYEWAVNYATVQPGSHLAAVVGDDPATLITDVHNGLTVAKLEGHRDFSFAAAWHPGGCLLATGNQDTTALVWDIRRTDEPLTRLAGRMGAIRTLRFTPDGRFLAMSEPADFVHLYDVASGFQDCQEHDFFGEIAGVAFTPDSSSLFVGVSDLTYASLMQLDRQRCDWQ